MQMLADDGVDGAFVQSDTSGNLKTVGPGTVAAFPAHTPVFIGGQAKDGSSVHSAVTNLQMQYNLVDLKGHTKVVGTRDPNAIDDGSAPVKIGGVAYTIEGPAHSNGDACIAGFDLNGNLRTVPAGNVAHNAVDSGNPIKIGGMGTTARAAFVSSLDRVNASFDVYGSQRMIGDIKHDSPDPNGAGSSEPLKLGGRAHYSTPGLVNDGDRVNAYFDGYGRLAVIAAGDVAHDAADSGNPVKMGGKASNAVPTAVGNNDRVNAYFTLEGRLGVVPDGNVAHDAADSGNPVKIGGRAQTAIGAAVADDDRVDAYFDEYGRQVVRSAAYDVALGADVVSPTITDADRWVPAEELVDTTNLAAATYYYPSADGLALEEYDHISWAMVMSGGVTVTFEGWNDDAAAPDVIDITKVGLSMNTGVSGAASYVDKSDIIDFEGINVEKMRCKVVTADNTNGVQCHIRRRKK
jgi:hypothetical protein